MKKKMVFCCECGKKFVPIKCDGCSNDCEFNDVCNKCFKKKIGE